ncbi:MAG TPA: Asp23/Gls24 family envelope stress response protein [Lachnospiraceae bacterium]|nr:Asp23/Gls24 family envelope stress response protein [Lachnospiraceae bacterium]
MEKELDRSTYVLEQDKNTGTVKIADDVVAMIAGIAATEVGGVAAMAGNITHEFMSKVGVKSLKKGVKVDVIGKTVRIDLALIMEYGYNIPVTGQKVQEKVKSAIENMTGLEVSDVNIRIAGVNMQKDR